AAMRCTLRGPTSGAFAELTLIATEDVNDSPSSQAQALVLIQGHRPGSSMVIEVELPSRRWRLGGALPGPWHAEPVTASALTAELARHGLRGDERATNAEMEFVLIAIAAFESHSTESIETPLFREASVGTRQVYCENVPWAPMVVVAIELIALGAAACAVARKALREARRRA
ncbi:MAG: hypothetical protein JNK53_04530, partial [Phycisphaerae bacterium]|nr:hypothetical protein [Phycisphaerae bacterium]